MALHFRSALWITPDEFSLTFSLSLSTTIFRLAAPQSGLKDLSVTPFDGPTIIVLIACSLHCFKAHSVLSGKTI